MELHDICKAFPPPSDEDFANLSKDIAANGQKVPIVTWQGKVIDGGSRLRVCQFLGREPITQEWDGKGSLVAYVLSLNLNRRHMTSAQKAALGAELVPFFEAEAKQRQKTGGKKGGVSGRGKPKPRGEKKVNQKIDEPISTPSEKPKPIPQAIELAAEAVGTNRQYVADAKKIQAEAPQVFEELKLGNIKISEAKKKAGRPPRKNGPKNPNSSRFDPGKRWETATVSVLNKELCCWPKKFQRVFASLVKEWIAGVEGRLQIEADYVGGNDAETVA